MQQPIRSPFVGRYAQVDLDQLSATFPIDCDCRLVAVLGSSSLALDWAVGYNDPSLGTVALASVLASQIFNLDQSLPLVRGSEITVATSASPGSVINVILLLSPL